MDKRCPGIVLIAICYGVVVGHRQARRSGASHIDGPLCRDRADYFHPNDFRVSSCSMCFVYLFPTFPHLRQFVVNGTAVLMKVEFSEVETKMSDSSSLRPKVSTVQNESNEQTSFYNTTTNTRQKRNGLDNLAHFRILRPDVKNKASMVTVCNALSPSQCQRWQHCCQSANECCDRQMKLSKSVTSDLHSIEAAGIHNLIDSANDTDHPVAEVNGKGFNTKGCPMTWDGYSCVQGTPAGQNARVDCPSFISIYKLSSAARATRQCLINGTWWKSSVSHMEWTDYSECLPVDFESMKVAQILAIVCNCISIACVLPSLVIFFTIRALRRQPRIQLHISLFVAMLLASIFGLLWERLVMYDMLVTPLLHNFVHTSPKVCRFLNMATRLSKTFTFFWMFCQGFHLQWLMLRSFKSVNALPIFSLIGWGIPILLVLSYIAVRFFHFNEDLCWITTTGHFEWIIDGPTISCIAVNVIFLAIILKALWKQLDAHPDDMGPFRRTVRALFLLIPLFGLQQFCILYRPHVSDANYMVYDVISAIIVNSQGALVAIIFCFMNEEVQAQFRYHFHRWFGKINLSRANQHQSIFSTTQMTSAHRPSVTSLGLPERKKKNDKNKDRRFRVMDDIRDANEV